jgi:hypothetical protein
MAANLAVFHIALAFYREVQYDESAACIHRMCADGAALQAMPVT